MYLRHMIPLLYWEYGDIILVMWQILAGKRTVFGFMSQVYGKIETSVVVIVLFRRASSLGQLQETSYQGGNLT